MDKQILIYSDELHVMAMNITDKDPKNWYNIWTKNEMYYFEDITIIDDSVILTNPKGEMVILDINNGTQLYQYKFQPLVNETKILTIAPSIDIKGNAIMIIAYEQPFNLTENIVFAFQ